MKLPNLTLNIFCVLLSLECVILSAGLSVLIDQPGHPNPASLFLFVVGILFFIRSFFKEESGE